MLVQIQQTKVLAGDGTQTDLTPQAPNLISMNIDVYPIQNLGIKGVEECDWDACYISR